MVTMMSRRLLFSLLLFLGACAPPPTPTPLPTPTPGMSAVDAGVQLIQQDMYLRLTQQAIESLRVEAGSKMTATQQVISATATQARYEDNTKATQRAEYATQAAWQVTVQAAQVFDTATAQAQATATQMAYDRATTTADAQGTATQMAVIGLTATIASHETSVAEEKTRQAPIDAAKKRALEAQTQSTEIKLAQEKATAFFYAWFFPVALGIILVVLVFIAWKKSKVGVIQDERGHIRIVMINGHALNPDLMFRPLIEFPRGGAQAPLLETSDADQRQVTHEAKIVSAIQALPPGYPRQGLNLVGGMTGGQSAVNIQVVQPGQVAGIRNDLDGQLLGEVADD